MGSSRVICFENRVLFQRLAPRAATDAAVAAVRTPGQGHKCPAVLLQ